VRAFDQVQRWPVETAAIAVVGADGKILGEYGPQSQIFDLASVTKLLSAYAVLLAVEEGAIGLDDPAGPPGSTIRHLLAHASGIASESRNVLARPGTRRIYSNVGFELLGEAVHLACGMSFAAYLNAGVLEPLGMHNSRLVGSPASAARSSVTDMRLFLTELQRPKLLASETVSLATAVAFPGLSGVLPGFGRQEHNDWGLGFEIRDGKSPHWTGTRNSGATFGHFGQSGSFLWVDPVAGLACAAVADRPFGGWAAQAWPELSDAVLAEFGR
jgi:CubicO group peptidase (beta-lactamase class C family)